MPRPLLWIALHWIFSSFVACERDSVSDVAGEEVVKPLWPIRRQSEPVFKWKAAGITHMKTLLQQQIAANTTGVTENAAALKDLKLLLGVDTPATATEREPLTKREVGLLALMGYDLLKKDYEAEDGSGYGTYFDRTLPSETADDPLTPEEIQMRRELVDKEGREKIEKEERLSYFPWLRNERLRKDTHDGETLKPLSRLDPIRSTVNYYAISDGVNELPAWNPETGASATGLNGGLRYRAISKLADDAKNDADSYAMQVSVLESAARRAVANANDMNDMVKDHVSMINRANRMAVHWNNEARHEHLDTVEHFAEQVHGEKWETLADQLLAAYAEYGTKAEQLFLEKLIQHPTGVAPVEPEIEEVD